MGSCRVFVDRRAGHGKRRVELGAFRPTNTISGDAGTNRDSGAGWGLRAGLGLSRYVAIEGNCSSTRHDVKNVTGTTQECREFSGWPVPYARTGYFFFFPVHSVILRTWVPLQYILPQAVHRRNVSWFSST